jgi:3-deoxy-D-manno-octulosonic-acid transferase
MEANMIAFFFDVVYVVLLLLVSPWLAYKALTTGKYRSGLGAKLAGTVPIRLGRRPCVWFHAVSVGEVMMLRRVVAALCSRRPDVEVVVSTSTNTGMDVARQHFAKHMVTYFPLDFTWAVSRALTRIRPDVVVLAELELWPNFIAAARQFGARIAVINGRMSPRSFRGYRRARFFMHHILSHIDAFAVQTDEFAQRFIEVGAPSTTVTITGSVKYDGVETDRNNASTVILRNLFGLQHDEIVWVAGSTSEPEEQMVLDAYERIRGQYPKLRVIVVPRHKERFEEVAKLIQSRGYRLLRRSQLSGELHHADGVILIDTIGELSAVWGLADIAFVGGTFAPRGGQNMIEPAGYSAAVVFGPGVWNFQDTVNHLLACGGARQVTTPDELSNVLDRLTSASDERRQLGEAARSFVRSQHGATDQTISILERLLAASTQPGERCAA